MLYALFTVHVVSECWDATLSMQYRGNLTADVHMLFVIVGIMLYALFTVHDVSECWDATLSTYYRGTLTADFHNIICYRWDNVVLFNLSANLDEVAKAFAMHDGTFCRDRSAMGRTWCVSKHANFPWTFCNYPPCQGWYY